MLQRAARACLLFLAFAAPAAFAAAPAASLQLDDLTWTEVREALRAGTTTIILPVGGTEQNGPHMALGKHNVRAGVLASRIAGKLGNALVAPVLAYVPEGQVSPPAGHMRFPGTISVPDDAFVGVLAGAARSMKQHGFRDIVLIGDSGNYQGQLKSLAARLNREWGASPSRAHYISAYYDAANLEFNRALRSRGVTELQIGTHAGLADTSLMLAVDPSRVRPAQLRAANTAASSGVAGDALEANAGFGQVGVDLIIDKTVAAIRQATAGRTPAAHKE